MASDDRSNASQEPTISDPLADPDFPVVAVGASAGGLEAFTDLLRHLPADTGMAFVFIQHLAPDHGSMLVQLLSKETAMPVIQIEDGTRLSPNQVHVIPPDATMTISGPALALRPRETAGTVIDAFLRSLAQSRQSAAVAVILSGTGSDGALGVQAIAEEGGVVFAEDPASAKFDGMPRSAIATGCVDFVLPPEGIAAELVRVAREPRLIQRDIPSITRQFPGSEKEFQALLDLLEADTGIDFALYRQTTFRRRVLRRMALLRLRSLSDYVEYVQENPDELRALTQDVLIRVTRFFRDPEVFDILRRKVFPVLIRRTRPDRPVRIWVPGCSTGEEAYSIAICFLEVAEQMRSHLSAQVFATDVNEAAIEKARRGAYIENVAADVSAERLAQYFVRAGAEFQVGRKLRDLCVFSSHDLLHDPPFSRMDLISCRNVLIYLESMHEQALSTFHFALNPGGYLLLGKSETAAASPELFAPLDKKAKLYVRQDFSRHPARPHASRKKAPVVPSAGGSIDGVSPPRGNDLRRQADRIVLERYGPPRVIVNSDLAVLPDGGQRLAFLSDKDHADALRNAIRTAGETGQSIRVEQVKLGKGTSSREVSVEVTPLGLDRQHFLIVSEDHPGQPEMDFGSGETPTLNDRHELEMRLRRVERELASSRAHLESVITEEEAANEEVVAANEELQSLNEELGSSKEELEATNEELTTVNQELQVRNAEIENAREFAQATIDTVRSALVVLGRDLRVLKANQSFHRIFHVSPSEIEHRFIYELGEGHWSIPKLRQLLEEVLPERQTLVDFEMECEVPPAGRRILLLNAHRFEGEEHILLSIEDVTESRRAAEELRQSQKMEAIGYLAAGVAHDFNNLLAGILGNASLVLDGMRENAPGRPALESVIIGSERAANLTRQLLAYAGKGRFYLERVDLSDVIIQTGKIIQVSIPSSVQLRLNLDKQLPRLLADPGQIQQVVTNLIINGVEAIGEAGGAVLVKTGRQTVTREPLPDLCSNEELAPGEYVFLEVQDNGSGMDETTKHRIFDPFFTTKFTGRGLGLAAVVGIVRQHKGAIQLYSVPGRGSSFRVLFPADGKTVPQAAADVSSEELRGAGTLLVVDDEEVIRKLIKSALERYGYSVVLAGDGPEGIRLFRERGADIGLVLLDVAMPGMDGLATLERIREIRPEVPVLVCSGFGDLDVEARFTGKGIAGFFAKPFTIKQLARKVKECMPGAPPSH